MIFTVTYRSQDGKREFLELDAPSKADIWQELESRGITAISVMPGPAPKSVKGKNASGRVSQLSLAKKAIVLSVLAVACLVVFLPSIKSKKPVAKNPPAIKSETATPKPPKRDSVKSTPQKKSDFKIPAPSGRRIDKRNDIPAPPSLEELQSKMTNSPPKKKVLFKNGVEQLIAMATPSAPGVSVPPLPEISDEGLAKDLERAMSNVIKAEKDDTEATLEKKLIVAEAKEEFRELREKEGFTITEYLNALRDKANLDAEFLGEAQKMSEELYHDQTVSDEDYIKYRNQINEKLRERGLPEIE